MSSCVLCTFALAPAAFAADLSGDPATGGATAPPAAEPLALAPTPAEAVEQAPAAVPVPAPPIETQPQPPVPIPVAEPQPQPDSEPVALAAVTPQTVAQTPALRPTSAVTAQADDDVVDVPVPRRRERQESTPAPAPAPAVQAAPRLPMTGFDLGVFTSAALVLLGTGVGLSAAIGPAAPRRR